MKAAGRPSPSNTAPPMARRGRKAMQDKSYQEAMQMTTATDSERPPELTDVERDYPGWHLFRSDKGELWAVTTRSSLRGSGTTLSADNPAAMRAEIRRTLRDWARAA